MILLADKDYIPKEKTVCALGLFDGVHQGHRLIINKAVAAAKEKGLKSAVFCFKTNTVTSKGENGKIEMLISDEEKLEKIEALGVDYIYSPDFAVFKGMTPEDFVEEILFKRLNCVCAVCGTDFTFGKFAQGKASDLGRIGEAYGMDAVVMDKLAIDGEEVSSTAIREYIKSGEISRANKLLGYNFGFELTVCYGNQLGRTWNFPTINQEIPEDRILPKFGVYCSRVEIDGEKYYGVTNIGIKPTVEKNIKTPLAETYIIDFDGDVYGKTVRTELYEFIRPERKFESFDELKAEIGKNICQAKKYFERID